MFNFPVGEMNSEAGETETGEGEVGDMTGPEEIGVGGRVDVIGGIGDGDVDVDDTGGGEVDMDDETGVGEVG